MASQRVRFSYRPGLSQHPFSNVRLMGSWDPQGRSISEWSMTPMTRAIDPEGCPCFDAEVDFDATQVGRAFQWGVTLDAPAGPDLLGIAELPPIFLDTDLSDRRQIW